MKEEPSWLQERRKKAWDSFSSDKAPLFYKYGLSTTTPLDGLLPSTIETEGNTINSSRPSAPTEQSTFSTLPQNPFTSLHTAFCKDILTLKIPDNTVLREPVFIQKTQRSSTFFEHVVIDVGKHCSLTVLESLDGSGGYHSGGVEIQVGEGSSLVFGSLQKLSPATNNVTFRTAALKRDARLEWITVDTGSRLTLSRLNGVMEGQGSSLFTKMMAYGSGSQHFDFDAHARHAAPDTQSDIAQKAVLDGQAKMIINGLVKIEKNAPRSNGNQKEDTLLLSPEAEASPIPNLEIDNNDVRCSHGTTVGQVPKDTLFYAMARGLDEEAATRTVVKGFFDPLISSLPLPRLQDDIRTIVEKRLEERS